MATPTGSNTTGSPSVSLPVDRDNSKRTMLDSLNRNLYPPPVIHQENVARLHPTQPEPEANNAECDDTDTRYWRHSFNLNSRRNARYTEMTDDPLDLSVMSPEIQLAIPEALLAPLDPATHKEVLDSAEELFQSDVVFVDLYLKKQLMLQNGYVAKCVRELKTDFTPSDTIKDTPQMKDLAIEFRTLGTKYQSDVTKLFISSVEFQKQMHMDSIPALTVQSIFRICHQHIKRFTSRVVFQKTGYADFDDSEDDTAATAKLEDDDARKTRERHLAGYATLFLITDLYGILRSYCYPIKKIRDSLPMNTLFRTALAYVVKHSTVMVYPVDFTDIEHELELERANSKRAANEVIDLAAADTQPDSDSETPSTTAAAPAGTATARPSRTSAPVTPTDASTFDGLFDEEESSKSTSATSNNNATPPPPVLPPKVDPPSERPSSASQAAKQTSQLLYAAASRLGNGFVTAASLLPPGPPVASPASLDHRSDLEQATFGIKPTVGIPEYIYTSDQEQKIPDGCPFMIGDCLFAPPDCLTDYRIARRTATEMKEIISFVTAHRRIGLTRATSTTLKIASLNDGRIKNRTNQSTLNVHYLLKSVDAKDEKERRGVLKKCISEMRNFFEKVYRRHKLSKQTTISFANPVTTTTPSPNPPTAMPTPPPSALKKPPPASLPPVPAAAPNTAAANNTGRKRGPTAPPGTTPPGPNSPRGNNANNARNRNQNKKARKNSQGGGTQPAPAAISPQPQPIEQPQASATQPIPAQKKKNRNRRRGKGKKSA
jgi:hypothetical protein